LDTDVLLVHDLFKHVFPDFSLNHVVVYRALWRIEPLSGERVMEETGLSRATVFRLLSELVAAGLIKKTSFKPVGYYAENPVKTYGSFSKKVVFKIRKGKEQLKKLVKNSSSLSNEQYLVKRDGGQTRMISTQTRQNLSDENELREYRDGLTKLLEKKSREKLKPWQLIGR